MSQPILVTGGTGTLGRQVVERLQRAGENVSVLSRRPQAPTNTITHFAGDLLSGEGVDRAVDGQRMIIHCAGGAKDDDVATAYLLWAAQRAKVDHFVHISVVGVDRIPLHSGLDRMMFGYFGHKLRAEEAVMNSGLPWTVLRATQFHDLMFLVAQAMSKMPIVPVPSGFSFQPVDSSEVANRLTALALQAPAGLVSPIAGPKIYPMADLLRSYFAATGRHRPILPLHLPGAAAKAFRSGANTSRTGDRGTRTWEEFLTERVPHSADGMLVGH